MFEKKLKSLLIGLMAVFQIMALSSFALAGDLSKYVVYDATNYYEYEAQSVTNDYIDFLGGDSEGKLVTDMTKQGNTLVAYFETGKARYISAIQLTNAYIDYLGGDRPSFNLQDFIANEADTYTIPANANVYSVSLNAGGDVQKILKVVNPTASAFSIGGTEVTTVNGVLSDNAITFAVDPTANYTTASVTVSADVYVTVTEYGASEPSRADVNVEKGTLTADVALLGAFDMTRTSATGYELINKTEAGPITVLLKSQADVTKTTTYTVNFVKAE